MISLENISYRYRGAQQPAVVDVNCVFEQGCMYALVGPSGSGKSTLLSILAGLDEPTDGFITFDGTDLKAMNLDMYRREKIAMIFQSFQLFQLMTVMENVCYPMELCGIKTRDAKPRARKLLERVGIIPEEMKRYPAHLSGGQQQRVAIARSLAAGARVILADEPTGNLDRVNTQNVIDILKSLSHDENYCVILVTHDNEAASKADVIYKMSDGYVSMDSDRH